MRNQIFFIRMLRLPVIKSFWAKNPEAAAKKAGVGVGLALMVAVVLLIYCLATQTTVIFPLMRLNSPNLLLCSLILLVSFTVHRFSLRYMQGDRLYPQFFMRLSVLTLSAVVMVLADNLWIFWGAWTSSNLLLVRLMIHKKKWGAARQAGILAFKGLGFGCVCLGVAVSLLYISYSEASISALMHQKEASQGTGVTVAISLIVLAALAQSGLIPFHRWLISSLNSPTPVSALMHAGLVNGGGILLIKFSPVIMLYPAPLKFLFLLGAVSAFAGTLWKLMQPDIKKMLACSTLAQMGFMMMQCGVGLFPAAIAHLCWHGLFKSWLFLSSGSVLRQNRDASLLKPAPIYLLPVSLVGGIVAMLAFAWVASKPLAWLDPGAFVLFFAFMAGSQLLLTWIRSHYSVRQVVTGIPLAGAFGLAYGASISLAQWVLPKLSATAVPPLSVLHWGVLGLFAMVWVIYNFGLLKPFVQSPLGHWAYMQLFNAGQPSAKTVTALRYDYQF